MNLATSPSPRPRHAPATTTDRAIRAAGTITAAYLLLGLFPMTRWAIAHRETAPPLLHLLALAIALGTLAAGDRAPRVVRDWMPLALGPFLYIELRWLIEGMGRPHADAKVVGWEHAVFGGDPSSTLATRWTNGALSELLHLCYVSYYLLVLLPPLLLYLRARREDFARTLLGLATVYAVCFTTYLVFPVDGPRFLLGPAAAPAGPIRSFVLHLLAAGSSRGTAFPSSHVAAAVVASLAALRSDRRVGIPVALLTVGLAFGAVYGGFHYGVDALAGLVVGLLAWALAGLAWRRLSAPGVQSATAA